jgi:AraC family transcriptional regulator, ethanolamine operon transcriptional activator
MLKFATFLPAPFAEECMMAKLWNPLEQSAPQILAETVELTKFDSAALSEVVAGAEFEHRRLPGGGPHINLLQCVLPNSVICRGRYQPAVLVNGTFARDTVTIGIMLRQSQATLLNGIDVRMGTVQFYAENSEMCYRAWPDGTWLAFVVPRERLLQFCLDHFEVVPDLPAGGIIHIEPESKKIGDELVAMLQDVDRSLVPLGALPNATRLGESVEHDVLTRMMSMICRRSYIRTSDDRSRLGRCHEMLRDAMKLVEHDPDEILDLHCVSKATGLSARTLQRSFQATCGLCPQEWFRVERLNRVRNDLLNDREGVSVTSTATRWGFFHFGRFAQYYRELFGERPSETLRSHQSAAAITPPG